MEAKAKLLGHPIHQMLIVFPLGLLATAVVFDIIGLIAKDGRWSVIAFYMMAAGLVSGVVAAIFGLIDFLGIPPNTRAKTIGAMHGIGNAVAMALFAASWFLRRPHVASPGAVAYTLAFIAAGLSMVTGWLGGELVDRLGIGVDPGANVNAPSSLHTRTVTNAHSHQVHG
jgi:uncharacterized membrane protein